MISFSLILLKLELVVRVHEFGQHQHAEVLVLLDVGVAEFELHFGALLDDRARKHRLDARLELLLHVFYDEDAAVLQARAQFVFELFVVEGRDFEVLLLLAELLGRLELRVDDQRPARGLVDDRGVLLGKAVVGQVLVGPLGHLRAVDQLGERVDVFLVRHATRLDFIHPVLLPDFLAELEVVRAELGDEARGDEVDADHLAHHLAEGLDVALPAHVLVLEAVDEPRREVLLDAELVALVLHFLHFLLRLFELRLQVCHEVFRFLLLVHRVVELGRGLLGFRGGQVLLLFQRLELDDAHL